MVTREKAQEFLKTFEQNVDIAAELDEQILGEFEVNKWPIFLEQRSAKLREIYATNQSFLKEIQKDIEPGLDADSAQILYDALFEMYDDAYDDPYVFEVLGEKLLAFYAEEKDVEKLVVLYHLMAFELSEYNWGTMERFEKLSVPAQYYLKVIELRDYYTEIKNPRARRFFFSAYCNLIAPLSQTCVPLRDIVYDLYDGAKELWSRPEVQALDGDNEDFRAIVAQLDDDLLFTECYFDEATEEHRAEYVSRVEKILAAVSQETIMTSGNWFCAKLVCAEYRKQMSRREIIELALTEYENLPDVDLELIRRIAGGECSEEEAELQKNLILRHHNLAVTISDYLDDSDLTESEIDKYSVRFLPKQMALYTNIPYRFETTMVNEICMEGYMLLSGLVRDAQKKREYLRKMVICRQPITLIHSKMVSRIAVEIAEELIWFCPEKLMSPCGYQSVEEVRNNREEVLAYIADCGLMHDIGKMSMVGVINQQTRQLSNREFGLVKEHPNKGLYVLHNDKDFEEFFDVMRGHHKFYDGKGGYPFYFDNVASPKRFLIDLITIADCADAATDILGRNYAKGKDFAKLLEELKADAGTRYNPDIVAIIDSKPRLQQELADLTVGGRYSVYYEAYREIREL